MYCWLLHCGARVPENGESPVASWHIIQRQHYLRSVLWCGEHPLAVCCASMLLSFSGQAILANGLEQSLNASAGDTGRYRDYDRVAPRLAHLNRSRGSPAPRLMPCHSLP